MGGWRVNCDIHIYFKILSTNIALKLSHRHTELMQKYLK